MKYHLTFLASLFVIGVSALPLDNDWSLNELDHDILDFYSVLPVNKVLELAKKLQNDPEVKATLNYVESNEFHRLLLAVEDLPEFKKYVLYLQEAGYNEIREIKSIHEITGMDEYVPPKQSKLMMENEYGGLNGYIKDVLALLPKEKIQKLHQEKLVKSPAYAKFNSYVRSDKFAQLKNDLRSKKEYIELKERSYAAGLDIEAIEKFKYQLLGIQE